MIDFLKKLLHRHNWQQSVDYQRMCVTYGCRCGLEIEAPMIEDRAFAIVPAPESQSVNWVWRRWR